MQGGNEEDEEGGEGEKELGEQDASSLYFIFHLVVEEHASTIV